MDRFSIILSILIFILGLLVYAGIMRCYVKIRKHFRGQVRLWEIWLVGGAIMLVGFFSFFAWLATINPVD